MRQNSCYNYCIARRCNWHDGPMIDIFVFPHVLGYVYSLKGLLFEGFALSVLNNQKDELVSQFGKGWFKFPKGRTPEEHPDVFNSCKKLKSLNTKYYNLQLILHTVYTDRTYDRE